MIHRVSIGKWRVRDKPPHDIHSEDTEHDKMWVSPEFSYTRVSKLHMYIYIYLYIYKYQNSIDYCKIIFYKMCSQYWLFNLKQALLLCLNIHIYGQYKIYTHVYIITYKYYFFIRKSQTF